MNVRWMRGCAQKSWFPKAFVQKFQRLLQKLQLAVFQSVPKTPGASLKAVAVSAQLEPHLTIISQDQGIHVDLVPQTEVIQGEVIKTPMKAFLKAGRVQSS